MKTKPQPTRHTTAPQPGLHPPPAPANTEPPDTEQARELLREVCILANMAIRVSRDRPGLIDDVDDDDRIQLLRRTLDRIGWVADVAERKLGGTGAFARAEDWMLPGV